MVPALAALGVGAVYWPPLHETFARHADLIQVAEIEPASFWLKRRGAETLRSNVEQLERIATLPQRKLLHGVGYPVGGTRCRHGDNVIELRRWAERLDPAWTSEHLSFNETALGAAGFLMPPCQSSDGVAVAAANIRARAAAIGRPFAFETGVSYLPRRPGEMDDGEYFAAVAEAADCHILLDLHNLWTNERNGRARVEDVLAALPLERVCEVHLAGGEEKDGYWLDAHSGLPPQALLDLAADVVPGLPALGALILEIAPEHLRRVPPAAILRQMEALHRIWESRGRQRRAAAAAAPAENGGLAAAEWEAALIAALRTEREPTDPSIALYGTLIAGFRDGALASTLGRSLRLLQLVHGEARIDRLLADYRAATEPQLYPSDEALQFAYWLRANGPETAYLDDILAFEAGIVAAACAEGPDEIRCRHDPSLIVAAVARGEVPGHLDEGDFRLTLGGGLRGA